MASREQQEQFKHAACFLKVQGAEAMMGRSLCCELSVFEGSIDYVFR
jgi:hypothetical protein